MQMLKKFAGIQHQSFIV